MGGWQDQSVNGDERTRSKQSWMGVKARRGRSDDGVTVR